MKLKPVIFIFVVFFCLWAWIPSAFSNGIKWHSYKDGVTRGKYEQKNVFLNFYADWCGFCKKMDKETFKDPAVIAFLNENFISVKVNSEKERKIAREYYVTGLPVSWFIAKNGEKISSLPGYVSPGALMNILKYIQTDSYKDMTFKDFLKTM
ncbi:thioredoxin family protein [Desulfonema magnum]|nr:thioredoxin fold domain-containing protein [Desulfonema magnum]